MSAIIACRPTPISARTLRARRCRDGGNRSGTSKDLKADAALRFARSVLASRGRVSDAEVRAIKSAGYTDAQIVEIVQHVALNIWTNYVNNVAQTTIDFPVVGARHVA